MTGLALLDGLLVATYGSGHLRVFDLASGQIRAQATAHARWITALDVAVDSGLVLTAGEDARVKVWSLTDSSCPVSADAVPVFFYKWRGLPGSGVRW